jgi:hypothetical protein
MALKLKEGSQKSMKGKMLREYILSSTLWEKKCRQKTPQSCQTLKLIPVIPEV